MITDDCGIIKGTSNLLISYHGNDTINHTIKKSGKVITISPDFRSEPLLKV